MKFKKGDRVQIKTKNKKVVYGVVSRGGAKKVTAIIDGNTNQVSGSPVFFSLSDHPLPTSAPSVMDKWGVKNYKEIDGHGDTPTFHAKLTLNGKVVGEAMNDGWGGCNCYHFKDNDIKTMFYKETKLWVSQFGYKDMLEPSSSWIDWYVLERPYGVTAEMFISKYKEEMDSFLK